MCDLLGLFHLADGSVLDVEELTTKRKHAKVFALLLTESAQGHGFC